MADMIKNKKTKMSQKKNLKNCFNTLFLGSSWGFMNSVVSNVVKLEKITVK